MYCDERDESYMVGEEEAIWLLRLLLPYLNEMLFKMRDLFSGNPATTMKLAVLLFVMARCGSSITISTLSKLTFFGIFTIPKICTSYSTQLARIVRKKSNIDLMAKDFQTLISQLSLVGFVVGYSFSLQGQKSVEAVQIRIFMEELRKKGKLDDLTYTYWDENYTSKAEKVAFDERLRKRRN